MMIKLKRLSILSVFNSFPLHKNRDKSGPSNISKSTGPDLSCIELPEWKDAAQANIMLKPKTPMSGALLIFNCRQPFTSPIRNPILKTTQVHAEKFIIVSDGAPIAPRSLIVSLQWL